MTSPAQPPLTLTPRILALVAEISELVGVWRATAGGGISPRLRRENRIRSIHGSLAIEANTLGIDQVTATLCWGQSSHHAFVGVLLGSVLDFEQLYAMKNGKRGLVRMALF